MPTDAYAALEGADALVIVTEWDAFRALDLDRVKSAAEAARDGRPAQHLSARGDGAARDRLCFGAGAEAGCCQSSVAKGRAAIAARLRGVVGEWLKPVVC